MMKSVPINRLFHTPLSPKEIHFRSGQIFQGKVVQTKANGFILVATEGKTLKAHTSIPLTEGKSYSFLVRTVAPRIELKVMRKDDSNLISSGKLWASGQKARLEFVALLRDLAASVSVKNLRDLLPLLLYEGPGHGDAIWLSQNLLTSGTFWENKVFRYLLLDRSDEPVATLLANDLKGLLLSLKKKMKNPVSPTREMQLPTDRIDRLLSLLENHQALNLDALREGWGWYWFIAGAEQKEFVYGELLGKKTEGGDLHHVRMNLFFTRLGEIYVDCLLREKTISVSILVSSEPVHGFLEKNVSTLQKGMEKRGLIIAKLSCGLISDGSRSNPFSEEKNPIGLMDLVI